MNQNTQILITIILFLGVVAYNRLFVRLKISHFIKVEKNKQEALEDVRREMARDFHDELGNHLASIISMVNVLAYKLNGVDSITKDILNKIEHASKELFNGTREFMWTMEPDHDNLSEILIFLRDHGVNFFDKTEISFEVDKDLLAGSTDILMPPGYARHVIAIFKEAMTNCLKHSKSTKATLFTSFEKDFFTINLMDDGKEIFSEMGQGQKNMLARAAKINSSLEWTKTMYNFTITLITPYV